MSFIKKKLQKTFTSKIFKNISYGCMEIIQKPTNYYVSMFIIIALASKHIAQWETERK